MYIEIISIFILSILFVLQVIKDRKSYRKIYPKKRYN